MKSPRLLHWLVLGGLLALSAGCATAPTPKSEVKPALQVTVDVPPSWTPFLEDDVSEAIFYRIAEVFKHKGFPGELVQLTRFESINPTVPLLQIRLMEWRLDHAGNVQCTFSADLRTGADTHDLGLFMGVSPQWITTRHRWWAFKQGLEESAESAIRDLAGKLQQTPEWLNLPKTES